MTLARRWWCASRRICIDLCRELVRLRPEWYGDGDDDGACKVVMTGSHGGGHGTRNAG